MTAAGHTVSPKVTVSENPLPAKLKNGGIVLTALDCRIVLNQTVDELVKYCIAFVLLMLFTGDYWLRILIWCLLSDLDYSHSLLRLTDDESKSDRSLCSCVVIKFIITFSFVLAGIPIIIFQISVTGPLSAAGGATIELLLHKSNCEVEHCEIQPAATTS